MSTQSEVDLSARKVVHDERVKEQNRVQRLLIRPEMGALVGADRDLHLLRRRRTTVPDARGACHGALCELDDRHHGLRASRC